jgi:hypothetical protein
MADDVSITAGAGTTMAADQRTINGTSVYIQRVDEQAGTSFVTGQVAPTNSAATVLAARETRKTVTLINYGTVDVYVGPATVTTANGIKIEPGGSLDVPTTALIQGITASGTGSIHYLETYS